MTAEASQAQPAVTAAQATARKFCRAITLAAVPMAVIAAVPNQWVQRDPFIGIFTLIWMAVPLIIAPALAILAIIGSIKLARDWRYALPAWLYVAAFMIIAVDLFLFSGEADLWASAGGLMLASLLAAAWVGWRREHTPPGKEK